MAKHWQNDVARTERGAIVGGPVELTWNWAGHAQLAPATPKSNKTYVFDADDLESLWATIQGSGMPCEPEFIRLYGTERHEDGGAFKALAGDIVRARADGQGNRNENGYSAKMVAKFEAATLQLRVMYGKPCLWAYQEAPVQKASGGNAKPKPVLNIKRVDVGGNVADTPPAPRQQVNRVNRKVD